MHGYGLRVLRRRLLACLVLACGLAVAWGCADPAPEEAAPMRTLLVTGFGPFLAVEQNPSIEASRPLAGEVIGGLRVVVEQLDVVYARAPEQLAAALERHRPEIVLCLGVAGDAALRLESTARNEDTAASPDMAGEVRQGRAIRAGGPATLPTGLPLARIAEALEADGYEVITSDDAGGYLCNHVFYEVLTRRPGGRAGFVHVPPLAGTWDQPRLTRAIRRILEVLAAERG
jgi:pyroglutamyl-peptidase